MILCLSLALHVFDEARHDFLSLYNPTVRSIREQFGVPLPIFNYETWIVGLIFAVALLFCLTPFAFRREKWMVGLSYFLGVTMSLNGLGHLVGSYYLATLVPGAYSSPILLAAAIYLLWAAIKGRKP